MHFLFRRGYSTLRLFKQSMEPLVVIFGSTGTGKSDLAVELATNFNGEIINADAMQMYEGLPIITNKITTEEQRGIPHHLLGNVPLSETPWTILQFKDAASKLISDIRGRGKLPILVGGSTYYLDGLLFDGRVIKDESAGVLDREELDARFPVLKEPPEVMLEKLHEVDPVMAERWHPNDVRKIRNSLEIYYTTGRRASEIYAEQRSQKESKWAAGADSPHSPWNVLMFWLYARLEPLNERLDRRVDKMVANGLLDETAAVHDWYQGRLAAGETVERDRGIVQSIGFWQFEPYLRTLKEAPESTELAKLQEAGIFETKAGTRRYAKYQVRWITTKTLVSIQEEKLLDRLFLLDGTDVNTWHDEVAKKGVDLTRKFLAGEQLPQPVDLSETAKEVLTAKVERSNRKDTPCNKRCDLCQKTFLTEELWQKHIKGQKHSKAVRWAKRRAVAKADPRRRALVVVEDQAADPEPA
ncbi:IPP transferase-domain-containing protein [Podospora aff. communis PSN243]|uniref:tRNA dimethylallyltransferase n=1 Tax=Podospora aff. communis PSN243 TaxID=3040156 RepID=A0AAV9GUH1_9PEZI|nr:IPP transferase-domain-containing protein [Podospora aff. communis PSN243]